MKNHLEITIPDRNSFYTLYSEGPHSWKTYDRQKKATLLYYPPGVAVLLYYTYQTYREACVIRNIGDEAGTGGCMLPGLSKKVFVLFRVRASRVDKLKRAAFYLNEHSGAGAYGHDDGFYVRLGCLLEQRGKLNYVSLRNLFEKSLKENQYSLF
jgi:hypothetical protein